LKGLCWGGRGIGHFGESNAFKVPTDFIAVYDKKPRRLNSLQKRQPNGFKG